MLRKNCFDRNRNRLTHGQRQSNDNCHALSTSYLNQPTENRQEAERYLLGVRFLNALGTLPDFLDTAGQPATAFTTIAYEARAVAFARAYRAQPRKTLILTPSNERVIQWTAKLQIAGVPPEMILTLPSGTSALFEDAAPEHIALSDRLGALRELAGSQPVVVVATPAAALERTLPADLLHDSFFEIAVNDELQLEEISRRLLQLGYEGADPVRIPGQMLIRGGIFDVFPTGGTLPIRIELFGDTVESIRQFDPNTQRSVGSISRVAFTPSRETIYPEVPDYVIDDLLRIADREATTLEDAAGTALVERVAADVAQLKTRQFFDRLDLYRPHLLPDSGCALDLLGEEGLLLLDDPRELETVAVRAEEELALALQARARRGEMLHATATDFVVGLERMGQSPRLVALDTLGDIPDWLELPTRAEPVMTSLAPYKGRADALALTVRNYLADGFRVLFFTDQPNRARSVLGQAEIDAREADVAPEEMPEGAYIVQGNLGGGFVLPTEKLAWITDAELFGVARLKIPQRRFMEGAPVATVLDLKEGDYVVHINFGIGIFRGLTKRTVDGVEKEFLFIEYQPPDKLFVPADQLDRIQKYLNPGDENPKLNKLTGGEWQRTLGKAREEAKAFARDLVKLYAQRASAQRRPYGPDTPFQAEMESTFPWVETPSQLAAIAEVKRDMQTGYPMDRLVCGDVGFGKTEVAIRAAFKAVQNNRQVAVLCPTTILSEQHFRNFEERLGSFGTRLGLINRFTHAAEKKSTMADLKAGRLDVIVGTHSLLGKGIEFKDLGLVIIDEEHKFGVKQKEMLKELRSEVDVLTMSATPIPRTLSMALMDIRQMSLINDPPPGRLPIRTYVRKYAPEVIREAILRELARGGQVFYVHNRVESIGHVAERLQRLVPNARIGVGHGQMSEQELEPIMVGFVRGEIDILLSTTIIENGIDIPNANTLIVENAERFGLSQLYQLRGRVGRSDRQAYAYFLHTADVDSSFILAARPSQSAESNGQPPELRRKYKTVSEGAMARLQALQEFSSLGSGYSLSFRDLQIRGAGELLGAKQSGTMMTVGYELYTQLIADAVATLKRGVDGQPTSGEDTDPLASAAPLPMLDLPVPALLPETFIPDQAQRLYYYQRLMSCRDEVSLAVVQAEVQDRYGALPDSARNAFTVMELRIWARRLGVDKLEAAGGRINVTLADPNSLPIRVFSILAKRNPGGYIARESFIWTYTGSAISATKELFGELERAVDQVTSQRIEAR